MGKLTRLSERQEACCGLDDRSLSLRRKIIDVMAGAGRGHLPSALSLVEILRVLYDRILKYSPDTPDWPGRDRLILSKGHGCMALYVLLAEKGFFPQDELCRFCKHDGILGGHPEYGRVPGVEASTGALGHGLSIGLGFALSARHDHRDSRVFVILGDGECNEGTIWEAALTASKHRLSNLTVLVDYNKHQSYGPTGHVLDLEPLADKWRAFGFGTREVDGHDVSALESALTGLPFQSDRPSVLICHTIKGKGIPFMENDLSWHHKSSVSESDVATMLESLGGQPCGAPA